LLFRKTSAKIPVQLKFRSTNPDTTSNTIDNRRSRAEQNRTLSELQLVAGSCIPNSSSLFQLLSLRETERKTKKTDPEKKFKKTQPQKTGVEGQEVVGWSSRGIASGKKKGAQQRWRKR
jgi:hypothetical protein